MLVCPLIRCAVFSPCLQAKELKKREKAEALKNVKSRVYMLETADTNSRLGTTKYSRNIDRAKYVICVYVRMLCAGKTTERIGLS